MTDTAKTIDHHVSAVLAKLGPPDRNAAAQAARLGLLTNGMAVTRPRLRPRPSEAGSAAFVRSYGCHSN